MSNLRPIERKVLGIMYSAWRPLNTNEIARAVEISWPTANKYLQRLYDKGYLRTKKKGKAQYWRLRIPPKI